MLQLVTASEARLKQPFRSPLVFGFIGHASACQPAFEPAFPIPGEFLGLRTTTRDVASLARLDKLKHVLPRLDALHQYGQSPAASKKLAEAHGGFSGLLVYI
jgi:hypothetical protein